MARSAFLAGIMRQHGISQGELVRRTGLSKPTIMGAYHGREVSEYTLQKIAIKLGVRLSELAPEVADDLDGLVVR
jgi:transcriptional regulator with XRE-family HTH domain